jgi:hypothetical protein
MESWIRRGLQLSNVTCPCWYEVVILLAWQSRSHIILAERNATLMASIAHPLLQLRKHGTLQWSGWPSTNHLRKAPGTSSRHSGHPVYHSRILVVFGRTPHITRVLRLRGSSDVPVEPPGVPTFSLLTRFDR